MNPPQHTALRKHLARHFTPKAVARFEDDLRGAIRGYLDELLPVGRADVLTQLALRVSVRIACRIIGLPVAPRSTSPSMRTCLIPLIRSTSSPKPAATIIRNFRGSVSPR